MLKQRVYQEMNELKLIMQWKRQNPKVSQELVIRLILFHIRVCRCNKMYNLFGNVVFAYVVLMDDEV